MSEEQIEQAEKIDPKSKVFFMVFFGLVALVVLITFLKYFVWKDYYIRAEADCDPEQEKCFVYECDPENDSECSDDPAERISYYKYIEKKAYLIPLCDPNSPDCPLLECQEQEGEDCQEIFCDDSTKEEGEECNDPEQYILENPAEAEENSEETVECAADDEECLNSKEETEEENGEDEEETNSGEEDTGTEENDAGEEENSDQNMDNSFENKMLRNKTGGNNIVLNVIG